MGEIAFVVAWICASAESATVAAIGPACRGVCTVAALAYSAAGRVRGLQAWRPFNATA